MFNRYLLYSTLNLLDTYFCLTLKSIPKLFLLDNYVYTFILLLSNFYRLHYLRLLNFNFCSKLKFTRYLRLLDTYFTLNLLDTYVYSILTLTQY